MDSSEAPDDSALDSLSNSIEKFQQKARIIGELDAKILQDPDEIEGDVYEAIELQDGISDRIDQIKKFISRHTKRVEPHPLSATQSLSATESSIT